MYQEKSLNKYLYLINLIIHFPLNGQFKKFNSYVFYLVKKAQ